MMKKAEESAALKSSFLANISAPMNAILGFTELLKNTNLFGEKQLDYFRIIEKLGNSVLMELDFLTSLFNPNFIKFEELIQQNIYSNFSVNELAQLCNMSLSSFKRKFAEIYKVSPMKYFLKIKLHIASELLKNKNNRISHIAVEVGFESLSTFNRSFRTQYGVIPSKFRLDENDSLLVSFCSAILVLFRYIALKYPLIRGVMTRK